MPVLALHYGMRKIQAAVLPSGKFLPEPLLYLQAEVITTFF
jgi:hypothetical protein